MKTLDEIYNQEHLRTIDIYQFNHLLFALARSQLNGKMSGYITDDCIQEFEPALILITHGRHLIVRPNYPDPRFFEAKVDKDMWAEFERVEPEKSKPVL